MLARIRGRPALALSYAMRLIVAAILGAILYSSLPVLQPLLLMLSIASFGIPTYIIVGALFFIIVLLSIFGREHIGFIAAGFTSALVAILDYTQGIAYLVLIVIASALSLLSRRFLVVSASKVEIEQVCSARCRFATIVYYVVLGVAASGFLALSFTLGSFVGSLFSAPLQLTSFAALLAFYLERLYVIRIIVFFVTAYVVYKLFSEYAEPLTFALLASPRAVREHIEKIASEEATRHKTGKTWYNRLFSSAVGGALGFLVTTVVYAVVDILLRIYAALASPEQLARYYVYSLWLRLFFSTIGIFLLYPILRRIAYRAVAGFASLTGVKPYKPRLSIALGILTAALLIYLGGTDYIVAGLGCPFVSSLPGVSQLANGVCTVKPNPRVELLNTVIQRIFDAVSADIQRLADTINGIARQLFGG